ncbi:hypothetical protein BX600DRAFT_514552 [Xylariales sp. PMI_506]|nr:hypothetical protein BX600DRAFT_514552 [Xylariales sp. PMI_506]
MRFTTFLLTALPVVLAANPVLYDLRDDRPHPPHPTSPHHPSPPHHTTTSTSSHHTTTSSKTTTTNLPTPPTNNPPPPSGGGDPPSGVTIKGISYAGSGCNAGSVSGALSSDSTTITLLYDSFIAQTGSGIEPADGRKNCQLNVQLALPQGWQFSVFKADYRGYAYLQSGYQGVSKATYYFSGETDQVESTMTITGAFDDNYLKEDEFGLESTVWSPCGEEGLLNINSEVRITPLGGTTSGLMTVDSTDLKFTQVHYLQWQEC